MNVLYFVFFYLISICAASPLTRIEDGPLPLADNYTVCTSEECVLAASFIIEALDESIDPCVDFFQFSCGGWLASNEIPSTQSRWSMFDLLDNEMLADIEAILIEPQDAADPVPLNQAKEFYGGCFDVDTIESVGLTPLKDFLNLFGGWPMTLESWNPDSFDWSTAVAESYRYLLSDYLIEIYVFADELDTSTAITYVDQPSLGLSRSVLTNQEDYVELVAAYKEYINSTAQILADTILDLAQLSADIEATVAFETEIAELTTPDENRREVERMYNKMTVQELQSLTNTPSLVWIDFLNTMFQSAGFVFTSDTIVVVREMEYLQQAAALIEAADQRTVANYVLWRQVLTAGEQSTQAMRDAAFQYSVIADGVIQPQPREEVCATLANKLIGYAVGYRYVQLTFSNQAKNDTLRMIADIRETFNELLDSNTWMDDETKPLAEEKAETIQEFIGYPDWYEVEGELDEYYAGLVGINNATHFNNVLTFGLFHSTDALSDISFPTERDKFRSPPTLVNAYYYPEFNSITFPAGILQPPFYRANSLEVLNYGGIGMVIGHEITHGFDDYGRQYDKDGNAIPWWSNATIEAFNEQAQCVIDQYSNYVMPETEQNLNGVNTQGENIADNGGLRQSYYAYQKYVEQNGEEPRLPGGLEKYSAEQLIFIANGNIWCAKATDEFWTEQINDGVHSPSRFRVFGPMSNMVEFSDAFSCPLGSPMNPVIKCQVW